jgi:hypothetical protein
MYQQPAYPQATDPNYIAYLEQRVRALETKCAGALVSGGFLKKSFAVWGYSLVASFIIGTIMSIIGFALSLIFGAALFGSLSSILQQQGSGPVF